MTSAGTRPATITASCIAGCIRPGSIKARLAVTGIRQMVAFCREHGVPHEICGKLVVAVDESEVARLRTLDARGKANGLERPALAVPRRDA